MAERNSAVRVCALAFSAWLAFCAAAASANTYTVMNANDSGLGSLRQAIIDANASGAPAGHVTGSNTINFNIALGTATITLQSSLPLIFHNLTIDGSGVNITIDGQNLYRGFFITGIPDPAVNPQSQTPQAITVSITDLTLAHCRAKGGDGGGAGGGGMGAGGGLFVGATANVTLRGVNFAFDNAQGGNSATQTDNAGGGGGLGGNGFVRQVTTGGQLIGGGGGIGGNGGGGGGGIGGNGGIGSINPDNVDGAGAGGFGGLGIGQISASQGFASAGNSFVAVGGTNGGGGAGNNGNGDAGDATGNGGFGDGNPPNGNGGGGAGGSFDNQQLRSPGGVGGGGGAGGGAGGFGGGGGGGGTTAGAGGFGGGGGSPRGNGGFGGGAGAGGGGTLFGIGGYGGGAGGGTAGPAGFGGGFGVNTAGGGGAGFGGAIFVMQGGTLTIAGPMLINGGTVTGGVGGTGAGNGAASGSGIFLHWIGSGPGGTINLTPGASESITISDDIVDQNGAGGIGPTQGAYTVNVGGAGTVSLTGTNRISVLNVTGNLTGYTTNGSTIVTGTGTISSDLNVNAGGIVDPGSIGGIGTLNTANVQFASGSMFAVQLSGAGNDQLNVTGTVNLGGAALNVMPQFAAAIGTQFTIINNDGSDAVVGTFNNLPEGATIYSGTQSFRITYQGGSGNDVVLTRADPQIISTTDTGPGSLRQAILYANASGAHGGLVSGSTTITFAPGLTGTIALQSALPMLFSNVTIDGTGANITIDGGGLYRGIFASGLPLPSTPQSMTPQAINVSLINLTLANFRAKGGDGGHYWGGGGLGAGGALFVNSNVSLTLSGVTFLNNNATGGSGGGVTGSGLGGGGGGGGMGGNGGTESPYFGGGGGLGGDGNGGGGGIGGPAGHFAGAGGGGFGGTGIGQISAVQGFPQAANSVCTGNNFNVGGANGGGGGGNAVGGAGGAGTATGAGGEGIPDFGDVGFNNCGGGGGGVGGLTSGLGGIGGGGGVTNVGTNSLRDGGFGGGGAGHSNGLFMPPGNGGFGGGGGADNGQGGNGGFGGGGAGGTGGNGGDGGFGGGGGQGCNGCLHQGVGGFGGGNRGGGGAGMGGAIFLVDGANLTISGPLTISGSTVTAGIAPAGTLGTDGSAFGSGLFLQGSSGALNLNPGAAQSISIGDVIADQTGNGGTGGNAGSRGLTLSGAGTLTLSAANTYTGTTTINAGTLTLSGSLQSATVVGGGTLSGTGTINNSLTVNSGSVTPGGSGDGTLSAGNTTFQSGTTLHINIDGIASGAYDQLNVTGTVNVSGATLDVISTLSGHIPAGTTLTLVNNDSNDAVIGTFNGLPEGSPVNLGAASFILSYAGGDGNDITLTRVNTAPVADAQTVTTFEDTSIGITLTGSDADGDPITFANGSPAHGTLSGTPPNLTYTPFANYNGSDSFTFTTSDGLLTSAPAVVTINITAVNDPPTFTSGGDVAVDEDSGAYSAQWATAISAGPPDEAGQTLTFNITGNSNAALFSTPPAVSPSGVLTFTPAPNAFGSATITVTLSDNGGGTDTSAPISFTITVNGINDPPSFTIPASAPAVDEDTGAHTVTAFATNISAGPGETGVLTFHVDVTASDSTLTFSSAPTIDPVTGNLTYTAADNAWGNATVTVTLSDDGSNVPPNSNTSAPQTFTITVNAVNDPPTFVIAADPAASDEDAGAQTVTGFVTAISPGPNEPDQTVTNFTVTKTGGTLTFSTAPAISADGTLTYTAAADANGTATFDVVAFDNLGGSSATQSFTITVNPINDPPSFTVPASAPVSVMNGGAQTVIGFATSISAGPPDEAGQTLTFHANVTSSDPSLTFSAPPAIAPNGTLTYTAATDAYGSATVSVTLTDSGSNVAPNNNTSTTHTFTIFVNHPPTFTIASDPPAVNEDSGAQTIPNFATNISPGPNESNQTVTGFTLTMTGGTLVFSTAPAISTTGTLTYAAAPDANGTATFSVVATDSLGATSAAQSFTITVNPVNDAPTFSIPASAPAVDEDSGPQVVHGFATAILAGPPDEAGQTLQFSESLSSADSQLFSSGPTIDAVTGDLSYTPAPNAYGTATVEVVLIDNGPSTPPNVNVSSIHTFTITINPVNDPPSFVIASDPPPANEDTAVSLPNFATSISPGPNEATQTVSFTVTQTGGPLTFSSAPAISPDGTLTYTPDLNANGTATFSVVATDNLGASSAAQSFTIIVLAVNDPPTFTIPADVPVQEDSGAHSYPGFVTNVSAGPPDESGQTVTFAITGNDSPQFFSSGPTMTPNGDLSFTLVPLTHGVATITVTATDSGSNTPPNVNTTSQTFTITINHVNHPPVAVSQTFNINEGDPAFSITIATDPDGDPLTFTSPNTCGIGCIDISGSPATYYPSYIGYGTDTFTVTATDPDGASSTATITINITHVNHPPYANDGSFTTDDDTPLGLPMTQFSGDPDNDPVTFTVVTPPSHGTLSGTYPDVIYTPAEPGPLTDSFVYSLTDPSNTSSAPATFTINTFAHSPQGADQQFRANSDTAQYHLQPAMAMDGSGNFVVVWFDQNGHIWGRRFDATGAPVADEFQVNNADAAGNVTAPRVAMDPAGDFVVIWMDQNNFPWLIRAQRYHPDGTPNGAEFTPLSGQVADVAMANDGSFALAAASFTENDGTNTVFIQTYDSSGNPTNVGQHVNTTRIVDIIADYVRVTRAGSNWVVAWDLDNVDGGQTLIHARIVNGLGVPQGPSDFAIGDPQDRSNDPSLAGDANGNFVITWSDDTGSHVQRFDTTGAPLGVPLLFSTLTFNFNPIATDGAGNYVVTWNDTGRIFGRRLDSSLTLGPLFRINSPVIGQPIDNPTVALSSTGRFAAAWEVFDPFALAYNVYAALSSRTATTTSVASSQNPSTFGQSVTFTATVTPSAATGTVTFKDGTTTLGTNTLSGGVATFTTSTLATGSHSITAIYNGNGLYSESTSSTLTQTVNNTLAAPATITAAADSTTQVTISWAQVPGATGYEVWRSSLNGAYAIVASTASLSATSVPDTLNIQQNTTYLYKVRATNAGGPGTFSAIDPATTIIFTDATLSGVGLKRVHLTELFTAANALRAAVGLPAAVFTDVSLNPDVRASNITDILAAINAARTNPNLGLPAITLSDSVAPGVAVKASHILGLRAGVQ